MKQTHFQLCLHTTHIMKNTNSINFLKAALAYLGADTPAVLLSLIFYIEILLESPVTDLLIMP